MNILQKSSSFLRDASKLASGTIIAQALSVLSMPLIARLYTPDSFGQLAVFLSISGIICSIVCMGFQLTIGLPAKDSDAVNLMALGLVSAIFYGFLTLGVLLLFNDHFVVWFELSSIKIYLWWLPVMIVLSGAYQIMNYWSIRQKQFGKIARAHVGQSASTFGGQLALAGPVSGAGGLIVGNLFGQAMATVILSWSVFRANNASFLASFNLNEAKSLAIRYRNFPIFTTWSVLLNTASWMLPALILAKYFSPTVAGFYALGFRLLQMPVSLIGSAVGQVLYQYASSNASKGNRECLKQLVEKTVANLMLVNIPIFTCIGIFGSHLFVFAFGAKWSEAGVYVQLLSPWVIVWSIYSPLSTLFSVLELQKSGLLMNASILTGRILALGVGVLMNSARISMGALSMIGLITYILIISFLLKKSGTNWISVILQLKLSISSLSRSLSRRCVDYNP